MTFMHSDTGKTYDGKGIYTAYRSWISENGGKEMGSQKFFKRVNTHVEMRKRARHVKKGTEYFALRIADKNLGNEEF